MGSGLLRDLSFDADENLLIAATSDPTVKLFNSSTNSSVSAFRPGESAIWSVGFDQERMNFLYMGAQNGVTYIYDIRSPNSYLEEFISQTDTSPVISIVPINKPAAGISGFLVCHLRSIWFFEYLATQNIRSTRLNITGPFISVGYDEKTDLILINTRPNQEFNNSRYVLCSLIKFEDIIALQEVMSYDGGKSPVMSRSTQIKVRESTMIAAYVQVSVWMI